jgi:SAM-dependent methyltransferase
VWPVTDYDGRQIPFEDGTFDVVFSSNVLEHVPHVVEFQKEIHRVLKPDGVVVHVLPSSSWRVWTSMTHLMKYWTLDRVHGEHAGNSFSEVYYFSRRWWTRIFRETGWRIVSRGSNELFYTGNSVVASRLSMDTRRKLARVLGASCNVFVLRKKDGP